MTGTQVYAALFEPEDCTSMARENEVFMDDRVDRGVTLARDWADALNAVLGRGRPYEYFDLYRRTGYGASAANRDGSITLSALSAHWTSVAGDRLLNAHDHLRLPRPTRAETESIRNAVASFGRVYGHRLLPRDPDLSDPLRVLDRGLRANIDVPEMIEQSRLALSFPEIKLLDDRYPLVQAAVRRLTGTIETRLRMEPQELDYLLRRTPAEQRFEVLADALIERDPLRRVLPDGSARTLPADHVAALKGRLVRELDSTFMECAFQAYAEDNDTAAVGNALATEGATNLFTTLDESRHEIDTDQRGYAQVATLMAAVQAELTTGDADYWSGELHEATLPGQMLGYAGPDRALTFDREKVIDVLATADPTAPPTPEVRTAVDAVASQAALLCNPGTPGAAPADPVAQAFEDQLRQDFVNRQRADLFAAAGFADPPRDATSEQGQTATAQLMAALTTKAGHQLRLDPHQVAAELLTTPPDERFAKAAALSLGNQGKVVDRGQWDSATKAVAGSIQTAFANAQEADRTGRTKLHAWSRTTAGRALSQQLVRRIDTARKPIDKASASADRALREQLAAATAGQAVAGSSRSNGAVSSTEAAHLPGAGRPGQGISGRG